MVDEDDDDDDFDALAEADEILAEDIAQLNLVIQRAKNEKEVSLYLDVAIKAKKLADLYYEALEDFSPAFVKYKKLAAENYLKVAKDLKIDNPRLMAGLMYLQINDLHSAEKICNELSKKADKKKLEPEIQALLPVCNMLMNSELEDMTSRIYGAISGLDKGLSNEISLTLKYLLAYKEKDGN
jgi:hypothetical protein